MYKYTDKIISYLNKKFIREFKKVKRTLLDFDQINELQESVDDCYETCTRETRKRYLDIAKHAYKSAKGYDEEIIDYLWLDRLLSEYDPVTKYIFVTEIDRKRARAFESLVATGKAKEVDVALRYYAGQVKQWGDKVTDDATIQAYIDNGIRQVRWKTEEDSRVCKICAERNNKIYSIDKIPPKPHIGCRCTLIPLKGN